MSAKIRHEWYQTDSDVVLSIFIRNVDSEKLTVDLQPHSLSLAVALPTGTDVVFDLDPLAHEISVKDCTTRVIPAKIEIKLKKKDAGIKWAKIEGEDEEVKMAEKSTTMTTNHAYPTSSRKQTNWDAVAKAAAAEDDLPADPKDPNSGGDAALNKLFQSIYSGGTDEQKKAMIKSYQESGGTALSTDWNEVQKDTVKIQPPDSMIAKKW